MSVKKPFVALFALLFLLAACQSTPADPGTIEPTTAMTPAATPAIDATPPADDATAIIAAARAHLGGELGIADSDIEVVSADPVEFSDSCLGLGGPAESCLQAITPGWLVMLDVAGQPYELHTDETGEQVRLASDLAGIPVDPEAATAAAVAQLAAELGLAENEIEVVSLEGAEFTDSCLGLGQSDESCLQVMTPGWRLMLGATGQTYEVRTDGTGQIVRIAGQP